IVVRLTSTGVVIDYRLEADAARAIEDLKKDQFAEAKNRGELPAVYMRWMAEYVAANLEVRLDKKPLGLRLTGKSCRETDSIQCDFRFEADWTLEEGKRHAFAFQEYGFKEDRKGLLH